MKAEEIRERLLESFPGAQIELEDLTGGGDHWRLRIFHASLGTKNLVQQHQSVYKALGSWMQGPIHALALETGAPAKG